MSYAELAFKIISLYVSTDEIPADDLKAIIDRSYSTFRSDAITPLVHLKDNLNLLELFHGPSYSFKDCTYYSWRSTIPHLSETNKFVGALQFLGNLFEYFLVRKNEGKEGKGESPEFQLSRIQGLTI